MPAPTSPPTPRTTSALVMGIIQTETGIDLTPFIAMANNLTTAVCTYTGEQNKQPYSDGFVGSQMELIERWLAAHFYTVFDNQLVAAKAGTASVVFQQKIDYGLRTSMYGQQAILADYQGNLAKLDNTAKIERKIKIRIHSMGRLRHPGYGDAPGADVTVEQ